MEGKEGKIKESKEFKEIGEEREEREERETGRRTDGAPRSNQDRPVRELFNYGIILHLALRKAKCLVAVVLVKIFPDASP